MATRNYLLLFFVSTLVAVVHGFDLRAKRDMGTPTPEECMKPPMSKFGHECCRLPKERIWGDLRPSLNACFRKMKPDKGMPDDMMTPETPDMMTPTGTPTDPFPSTSPDTPTENRGRRPHGKKPLSERLKEIFTTVYKEIKNTINSIWQSVVIITDHFRRVGNDSCFMECVFEDQGFLMNKMVNKAALLERLAKTLGQNEQWHTAAANALETCYQKQMEAPSNNTCHSGSEEIFKCVFKQIFFNCPNWTQRNQDNTTKLYPTSNSEIKVKPLTLSDYCIALKEFYQKCPDGPPPQIDDNHSTPEPPPPSAEDSTEMGPSAETERYTPQPE